MMIVLSKNLQVLEVNGAAPNRVGTVPGDALGPFKRGPVVGGGFLSPAYAAAVGLSPQATSASQTAAAERLLENGTLALEVIRRAVAKPDRTVLRQLCGWFPFALRMPEVHTFLDGLPLLKARQIAGRSAGRGRPRDPDEQLRLVATMDLLIREKRVRPAQAARTLAEAVKHLNVTARHLENLYSACRGVVRCFEGYQIPAFALWERSWGESADEPFTVYTG
jgi:hypothetical protein